MHTLCNQDQHLYLSSHSTAEMHILTYIRLAAKITWYQYFNLQLSRPQLRDLDKSLHIWYPTAILVPLL